MEQRPQHVIAHPVVVRLHECVADVDGYASVFVQEARRDEGLVRSRDLLACAGMRWRMGRRSLPVQPLGTMTNQRGNEPGASICDHPCGFADLFVHPPIHPSQRKGSLSRTDTSADTSPPDDILKL